MRGVNPDGTCMVCGTQITTGGCPRCTSSYSINIPSTTSTPPVVLPISHTMQPIITGDVTIQHCPKHGVGLVQGTCPKCVYGMAVYDPNTTIRAEENLKEFAGLDANTVQAYIKDMEARCDYLESSRRIKRMVTSLNYLLARDENVVRALLLELKPCDESTSSHLSVFVARYKEEGALSGLAMLNWLLSSGGRKIVALLRFVCSDCDDSFELLWDGAATIHCKKCSSTNIGRACIGRFRLEDRQ